MAYTDNYILVAIHRLENKLACQIFEHSCIVLRECCCPRLYSPYDYYLLGSEVRASLILICFHLACIL
jgi:hypothetical protein